MKARVTISGTEYGGFPPPLIGVNVFLPKGTVLHPSGFPTCPPRRSNLRPGPKGCPKGSAAGPVGKATGYVAFGATVVPETATIESFYAPAAASSSSPSATNRCCSKSSPRRTSSPRAGCFGQELIAEVPLVETVPGAQDASVKSIASRSARRSASHGKPIYYGRVPKKCPKGGFPGKAELTFAGLGGLTQQTVTKTLKVPCPRPESGTSVSGG